MGFEELVKKTVIEAVKEVISQINIPVGEVVPNVMNVKQVAKYLGCSTNFIYDNVDAIPHFDAAGYRFNKEDIDKWRLDKTGRSYRIVPK